MENFDDIFSSIAKRYILAYKTLERGRSDDEKEIEKYKKNIETIDELMTNLAISIKMKYDDIEQINKLRKRYVTDVTNVTLGGEAPLVAGFIEDK